MYRNRNNGIVAAWRALWGLADDSSVPTNDYAPATPHRIDGCPSCGCEHMTAGGATVRHESNGSESRVVQVDGVMCCLSCGERWYGTPQGLKRPHEAALPPQWAMLDMQARATASQTAARREATARRDDPDANDVPRKRGPSTGFRVPPKPR